jgi:C_GCAxxG_C_C family probable redox protein
VQLGGFVVLALFVPHSRSYHGSRAATKRFATSSARDLAANYANELPQKGAKILADLCPLENSSAMNKVDAALENFKQGFNCSQAVFAAWADQFGLERAVALKLAAGFGGGIGRLAEDCGAVTGAIMVLGLRYGAVTAEDQQAKEHTYQQVRALVQRFKARHGTVICRELLGCDISTPEGLKQAKAQQFHSAICPKFVRDAGEILQDLLNRPA